MMRSGLAFATAYVVVVLAGCANTKQDDEHGHAHNPDGSHPDAAPATWSVTAWGDHYEIFAEAGPLVAGVLSKSHTHVTVQDGFAPLAEGVVTAILRDDDGQEQTFDQKSPVRPGIFSVWIVPEREGDFDLAFRIRSDAGTEVIAAGRVSVGPPDRPGSLIERPSGPIEMDPEVFANRSGDPVEFSMEQQWRTPFATAWATTGELRNSVRGPAHVRPAAGGEAILTAPLDGIVDPAARLFVGLSVGHGEAVVQLRPRATSGRSYTEIESEARLAAQRLERLEALLKVEAVSGAEVERARAEAATLQAELDALRGAGPAVSVQAPFRGRVADVMVVPGQAVEAGDALTRLVQTEPLWLEVHLRPQLAASIESESVGLVVHGAPGERPTRLPSDRVRLISRAPEVDRQTGTVQVIYEVRGATSLKLGTTIEAEVLLAQSREGVVVPAEAIVDDAGVPVVYVHGEGERFIRQEVTIRARQGDRALVDGLVAGERIVTRGGAAIRRAAQLTSGAGHGHVH